MPVTEPAPVPNSRPPVRWITILDGHRLRQLRQQCHLTRAELADRAGISSATIAKLERQTRATCRSRTLARLAAALGQPPAAITPSPAADNTR
jgi:transcriptional regulator with XRE-family HTH domain